MLSLRPTMLKLRCACIVRPIRTFSSKSITPTPDKEGSAVTTVAEKREEMLKYDRHMVWGTAGEHLPAPVLPKNPAEISALDPADQGHRYMMDGEVRHVVIRQREKSERQAPMKSEETWRIFFDEDGTVAERWVNPLMGWVSSADPYQTDPLLTFETAAEAVYFAKKRGWRYIVAKPILRYERSDGAQYQDNFLPKALAAKVKKEGTSCDHWHRTSACTSHYFRPLKYHGDGLVQQHGPNGNSSTAPHVEGNYKLR